MTSVGDIFKPILFMGVLLLILPTLITAKIPTLAWIIGIIVILAVLLKK